MTNITIIAEFGTEEPEDCFEIQYRDTEGVWGSAVGLWDNAYTVESSYNNADVASAMAETLFKVMNMAFRVVQLHEDDTE